MEYLCGFFFSRFQQQLEDRLFDLADCPRDEDGEHHHDHVVQERVAVGIPRGEVIDPSRNDGEDIDLEREWSEESKEAIDLPF